MKKVLIICGVLIVIAGIIIVAVYGGLSGLRSLDFSFSHDLSIVDETKTVNLEGNMPQKLEICTDSYSVYVRATESDSVSLKYVGNLPNGVLVNLNFNNGVVSVTEADDNNVQSFAGWLGRLRSSKRFLVVEVPQSMFESTNIDVTVVAGCVCVDKLDFGNFTCKVSAGTVQLTDCKASDVSVSNEAGTVLVENLSASNLTVNLSAGTVNAKNVAVSESLAAIVEAGTVKCEGAAKNLTLENNAGSVNFKVKADTISVKVDAGSVRGEIEGSADDYCIKVIKDLASSNISSNNNTDLQHKLTVEVSTGSINIDFV